MIGALDPDQRITGQGILRLRRAGIAVDLFSPELMAEVEELNRDFTGACEARSATQSQAADKTVRDLASWLLSYPIEDRSTHPGDRPYANLGDFDRAIEYLLRALENSSNSGRAGMA